MAKINDLPLLSNPTEDMYCLVGKEDLQKVPWSAIMGQIGAPYIATTVAGMTDKTRVYVYQGSESGYTSGNWYYWNGSAWTSGGTYNSAAVDTDKTLTQSDKPADSAVVGKEIGSLKESVSNKITKFYASNQGETHITDSDNGKIQDMMIYGKSSQDGTPTTDNPVEIKSVVNPTVKIVGKNLLNATLQTITLNGVTCINNGDGTYTLNGTPTVETDFYIYGAFNTVNKLPLDSQKTYIVKKSGNSKIQFHVGEPGIYTSVASIKDGYIKNREIISYFICRILSGAILNNFTIYPQVEEGSVSTDFQPYHEQAVALPYTLNAIPVESGGNVTINGQQYVADYVDVERGKLVRMVDSSKLDNTQSIIGKIEWLLAEPQEINLTAEQTQTFKALATYYPTTNISVNSEQLDGYTVFNYPISMANGWNYVKQQLNDNRDYIYDMDLQSAEAYVNSEYAVALTELEV